MKNVLVHYSTLVTKVCEYLVQAASWQKSALNELVEFLFKKKYLGWSEGENKVNRHIIPRALNLD